MADRNISNRQPLGGGKVVRPERDRRTTQPQAAHPAPALSEKPSAQAPKTLFGKIQGFTWSILSWAISVTYWAAGAYLGILRGLFSEFVRINARVACYLWTTVLNGRQAPAWMSRLQTATLLPPEAKAGVIH